MATFIEIETRPGAPPAEDPRVLPPGVRAAAQACFALLVVIGLPYVAFVTPWGHEVAEDNGGRQPVGWLEPALAWIPGERVPFTGMFRTDTAGPVVAEAGGPSRTDPQDVPTDADVAPVATLTPTPPSPVPLVVTPPPVEADGPAASAAAPAEPDIVIPPSLYEGMTAGLEDPKGVMTPFWDALLRTARGEKGAITRIAHWGDSAIAADGMTHAARRHLQGQFGDAGHGFVLVEAGSEWYVHKDVKVKRKGWKASKVVSRSLKDGHYGYGGSSARGYLGAWATFGTVDDGPVGTQVSRFEVLYARAPKHGTLKLTVDGGEATALETAADALEDALHVVEVDDGPHTLKIRSSGGGPVRVYGVAMERAGPGVVYDCLGVVGARGSRLLAPDVAHFKRQLAFRRPDLVVLLFGGNDLADTGVSLGRYEATFRQLVQRFREVRPEAACLVMSPLDHGERYRRRIRTVPRLLDMIPIQRRVALEEGCAFWSAFDAMGGDGAMGRWVKQGLGWADYAHLTASGAERMGTLFYRALMKGLADHLASSR